MENYIRLATLQVYYGGVDIVKCNICCGYSKSKFLSVIVVIVVVVMVVMVIVVTLITNNLKVIHGPRCDTRNVNKIN